jgi:regulator of sigma E protease
MTILATLLKIILLIVVVLAIFNVIIFVHELGHFLAGKWRGLKIDRFQIWFGKPIWKKEIGGVQYGLGWIPAGGFVSLPQMAPMESIEGKTDTGEPLPPVKPIDKIIVAFAGPLFSLLLALLAGVAVWAVGKPKDFMPSQIVGMVEAGSPAEKAGIRVGDKITHVNGEPVRGFAGTLDSIFESVILSKGDRIAFTLEREGEAAPLKMISKFETEKTKWWQRSALRRVGIAPPTDHLVIVSVQEGSPAARAGLKLRDKILSIDGQSPKTPEEATGLIKAAGERAFQFTYEREGKQRSVTLASVKPISPSGLPPMVGLGIGESPLIDATIVHPDPIRQVKDSLRMMWTTVSRLVAPDSSINLSHLSGPVGIAKVKYDMLQMDHPWQRILAFMVLFNVNLAVLNMLPLPVLDGGHITLAALEMAARRPVKARILEVVQSAFAIMLISVMLYVASKDIGDFVKPAEEKIVFPQP